MWSIFLDNIKTFQNYAGSGFLWVLFLAALLYLLIREKSRPVRLVMVYLPLLLLFAFFFPPVRKVFTAVMDEGNTFYRLLWTIPMGVITAYAACHLIERHRRIGLVVVAALIILCGKYTYSSQYIAPAENRFHIPQAAVDICNEIAPKEGENRVRAAFPSELVYFVRQYNTDILMPFGREMVEAQWDYYNAVYEVMEKPATIEARALVEATRETKCSYVILNINHPIDEEPTAYGLEFVKQIGAYKIYKDPEVILNSGAL